MLPEMSFFTFHRRHIIFLHSFPVQLEAWIEESVPMRMPSLFVRTRWQSKADMCESLLANKQNLLELYAQVGVNAEVDVLANHDRDWDILSVGYISSLLFLLFLLTFTRFSIFRRFLSSFVTSANGPL